jgi:nucleoid-associated protein YgaU
MNQARSEIARAESYQASEYAPEELEEAKKSLFQAHDQAAAEKSGDAKRLAEYAISKSYDALEKSLPKVAAKSREEATEAIDQADNAYATGLATEDFDRAIQSRKEGDQSMESGDRNRNSFLTEADDSKKSAFRRDFFQDYETSIQKYQDSKRLAESARDTALANREELKESARFVEQDLDTAERYLGGANDATRSERDRIASASLDIDNGDLKKASSKIELSRGNAKNLVASAIQNYARERNLTATEVVEDANARFEEIQEESVTKDPGLATSYEGARENLGAANEALAASGNLLAQEKYEDSIQSSEEAIRLSEIVIEQTAALTPASLAGRGGMVKSTDSSNKKPSASGKAGELKEGWTKYTVKKQKPEDCLWRIASKKEFYGNAKLWPRIYQANKSKIKNKNLIYPNQVLYIPPKTGPLDSPYKNSESESDGNSGGVKSGAAKEVDDSTRVKNPTRPVNASDEMDEDSSDDEVLEEEGSNPESSNGDTLEVE